jgi:hypothetical protein
MQQSPLLTLQFGSPLTAIALSSATPMSTPQPVPQNRQGAFCHETSPELLLTFCQSPKLIPGKSVPAVATALLAAAYFINLRLLIFMVTSLIPYFSLSS